MNKDDLVRAAWKAKQPTHDAPWLVTDVFDDGVMVVQKDALFRRVTFSVDGEEVSFGSPDEIMVKFEALGETAPITSSTSPTGAVWDVRVLKFGTSLNGWVWTKEAGEKLMPHLQSAPVGVYVFPSGLNAHAPDEAVMSAAGAVVRNVVADLQEPRLEPDGVYAKLHIHEDAGWLKTKLMGLQARGVVDKVLGLSIDTLAGYVPVQLREGAAKVIKEIGRLISVDIVTAPSADGRFLRATAGPLLIPTSQHSGGDHVMTRDQILALIKANRPDLLAGRVVESLTDETLQSLLSDAMKPAAAVQATASTPTATTAAATASTTTATAPQYLVDMERRYQVSVTQARVIEALAEAKTLPELSRERIRKEFHDKVADAATIAVRIAEEREFVVRLLSPESGEVRQFGGSRSEVLAAPRDKIQAGLDRLIFRDMPVHEMETGLSLKNSPFNHDTVRRIQESWKGPMAAMKADRGVEFRGLRDAYCTITGDSEVTGQIVRGRASEALLSTTWAEVFANTLYRRFLMEYALPMYNERSIALFGSAQDFRTKETVVLGYFGDISSVDPEVNDYTEIATPGDDKVSYAVTQRGNILTISRKAIINDDIQGVSRLVARLGRAARRTLARFIWNFWTSNAVYDVDSVAWFNAAHGNTGTVALTADLTGANEVLAKIQQLADMVEQGSAEKLGLPPLESLWLDVPHALMGKAWQINDSREFGAGNVNPVLGMFGPPGDRANGRINVNPLYTDVTDWGVHMMPGAAGRESIQVDFLGGREEPEFFLADTPTIGQAFIGDKIQYKIRFEFGGDVSDVKGACKNIVAG